MAVTLSAAASLASWFASITATLEAELAQEAEQHEAGSVLFAPYLSGERTPWNRLNLGLPGSSQ